MEIAFQSKENEKDNVKLKHRHRHKKVEKQKDENIKKIDVTLKQYSGNKSRQATFY